MEEKLKIFKVSRIDYGWEEDYEIVVLARDKEEALYLAKEESWNFREDHDESNFVVKEIDMEEAKTIAVFCS